MVRGELLQAALNRILEEHDVAQRIRMGEKVQPYELFHHLSDDFWLWCLTAGYRANKILQSILPDLPSSEIQERFTGQSGVGTFEQAFSFKSVCFDQLRKLGLSAVHELRYLDFGCGWGRISRALLNSVPPDNIHAADVLEEAINICIDSQLGVNLQTIAAFPPIDHADDFFDVVLSYSVFSHLSADCFLAWMHEFHRILRPGGAALLTTRPREAIHKFKDVRDSGDIPDFIRGAASSFVDWQQALDDYDAGRFCFDPKGSGGEGLTGFYGEACIPLRYVQEHLGHLFRYIDMIHFRIHGLFDQNIIVLRSR